MDTFCFFHGSAWYGSVQAVTKIVDHVLSCPRASDGGKKSPVSKLAPRYDTYIHTYTVAVS